MKDFDIEKARQGAEICTRDGRKARIVCYDVKNEFPIVALVDENGREWAYLYTQDGKFTNAVDNYCKDLMLVGEKHEGWVNIYKGDDIYNLGAVFDSEEFAKDVVCDSKHYKYIKTIKVEWEE